MENTALGALWRFPACGLHPTKVCLTVCCPAEASKTCFCADDAINGATFRGRMLLARCSMHNEMWVFAGWIRGRVERLVGVLIGIWACRNLMSVLNGLWACSQEYSANKNNLMVQLLYCSPFHTPTFRHTRLLTRPSLTRPLLYMPTFDITHLSTRPPFDMPTTPADRDLYWNARARLLNVCSSLCFLDRKGWFPCLSCDVWFLVERF